MRVDTKSVCNKAWNSKLVLILLTRMKTRSESSFDASIDKSLRVKMDK